MLRRTLADLAPHAHSQWVDYQRSIGIGRIYLYDHLSPVRFTDQAAGRADVLAALRAYVSPDTASVQPETG